MAQGVVNQIVVPIEDYQFEFVPKFKYVGSTMTENFSLDSGKISLTNWRQFFMRVLLLIIKFVSTLPK